MFSFGASKPLTPNAPFGSSAAPFGASSSTNTTNLPAIGVTPPATPGGLFGNKFNTTTPASGTNSLFGSSFGSTPAYGSAPAFGSTPSYGSNFTTPQQQQQQQQSNIVPYPKSTMFLDLPKEMQTSLESIEKMMHKEIEVAMSLDSSTSTSSSISDNITGTNFTTAKGKEIKELINKIERKISLAEAGQLGCEDVIQKSKHTIYTYWRYGESVSHREQNKIVPDSNGNVTMTPATTTTTILPNPSSSFLPLLLASLESDVSELEIASNILRRQIDNQNGDLSVSSITEACKKQHLLLQSLSSRLRRFIDSS